MKNVLKTLFTGKDNESFDLGRVLWALAIVSMIAFETYNILRGNAFEPVSIATALGGLITTGAAALRIKHPAEPGS